jgi:predicted RNA-binding protein YlxR (DUF448 family)
VGLVRLIYGFAKQKHCFAKPITKSREAEVAKKTAKRTKHVPQRTCVGCRETLAKRALIRVVRTSEGVRVDPTGKLAGRGAYLHDRRSCWERGIKGVLARALKVELTDQDREGLYAFMAALPNETEAPESGASQQQQAAPRHSTGSEELQAYEAGSPALHGAASLPEPHSGTPERNE